jgi:hypothetical protein
MRNMAMVTATRVRGSVSLTRITKPQNITAARAAPSAMAATYVNPTAVPATTRDQATKVVNMPHSPWAKLSSSEDLNTRTMASATKAYAEPMATPLAICSLKRDQSSQGLGARKTGICPSRATIASTIAVGLLPQ